MAKQLLFFVIMICGLSLASCKEEFCDDTCFWPNDGECDDGGEGSLTDYCAWGTDCSDCGIRKE